MFKKFKKDLGVVVGVKFIMMFQMELWVKKLVELYGLKVRVIDFLNIDIEFFNFNFMIICEFESIEFDGLFVFYWVDQYIFYVDWEVMICVVCGWKVLME